MNIEHLQKLIEHGQRLQRAGVFLGEEEMREWLRRACPAASAQTLDATLSELGFWIGTKQG